MGLLKDVWVDKNNGEVIDAETDNLIAHTVIDLQDEVANVETTATNAYLLADTALGEAGIGISEARAAQATAESALKNASDNSARIDALETDMGDVETALDGIIAIQNSLMGVSE